MINPCNIRLPDKPFNKHRLCSTGSGIVTVKLFGHRNGQKHKANIVERTRSESGVYHSLAPQVGACNWIEALWTKLLPCDGLLRIMTHTTCLHEWEACLIISKRLQREQGNRGHLTRTMDFTSTINEQNRHKHQKTDMKNRRVQVILPSRAGHVTGAWTWVIIRL